MPKKTKTLTSKKTKKEDFSSFSRNLSFSNKLHEWKLNSSSLLEDKKWIIRKLSNNFGNLLKAQDFLSNKANVLKKYIKKKDNFSELHSLNNEYFHKEIKSKALLFLDYLHFENEEMEIEKNNKYLSFLNELSKSSFSTADNLSSYFQLINFDLLQKEVNDENLKLKKELVFSELVQLNLSRECEEIELKIHEISQRLSLQYDSIKPDNIKYVQFKGWKTTSPLLSLISPPTKKIVSLDNSIPYLFFKTYFYSEDLFQTGKTHLSPPPKFIEFIAKKAEKWSVLKYISPEEVAKKMEGAKGLKVSKKYIQWTDPEEKWFYHFLPLINLYFDRFREKYIYTNIVTWDQPEIVYPLTEVDSSDTLSFSEDYKTRPIFKYEGIPKLRIGGDLQILEDILDYYQKKYDKESAKLLDANGLAINNSSVNLEDCLKTIKQEFSEL
ncbi:hypothetical protein [Mycoplasma parvum]|uniref:Uncharacterized protein n=1 Tax=Mycoplasma parvum str. Indiana TaxID=1403316 RepID=U5NCZ1_9MOLU|nr:hypothetical protein [Mycoplasma parvum]AGX89292.1 hypothetical protein PRV_02830 [Mycoplasma parvum str. Indiana]